MKRCIVEGTTREHDNTPPPPLWVLQTSFLISTLNAPQLCNAFDIMLCKGEKEKEMLVHLLYQIFVKTSLPFGTGHKQMFPSDPPKTHTHSLSQTHTHTHSQTNTGRDVAVSEMGALKQEASLCAVTRALQRTWLCTGSVSPSPGLQSLRTVTSPASPPRISTDPSGGEKKKSE